MPASRPLSIVAGMIALLITLSFVGFIAVASWPEFKMEVERISTLATIIGNPLMLILGFYFGYSASNGQTRRQADFAPPPAPPAA